jgi:hypothetical protein
VACERLLLFVKGISRYFRGRGIRVNDRQLLKSAFFCGFIQCS